MHYPPYPFPENREFPLVPLRLVLPDANYSHDVELIPAVRKSEISFNYVPSPHDVAGDPVF